MSQCQTHFFPRWYADLEVNVGVGRGGFGHHWQAGLVEGAVHSAAAALRRLSGGGGQGSIPICCQPLPRLLQPGEHQDYKLPWLSWKGKGGSVCVGGGGGA